MGTTHLKHCLLVNGLKEPSHFLLTNITFTVTVCLFKHPRYQSGKGKSPGENNVKKSNKESFVTPSICLDVAKDGLLIHTMTTIEDGKKATSQTSSH